MENFVFQNPTKIIFGKNTVSSIGEETALYGKKILLVYGEGSIFKNDIYSRVVQSLENAGVTSIEHSGVCSNPLLSHVRTGINLVKKNDCQAVLAVGGGSVIDEAKAICAGSLVQHDVWKFFTGKKTLRKALPLTCVLTLAASGSEMNSGMVITNEEKKQKFGYGNKRLFPKTSILDPETTFSVPPNYSAYGAVDAISHLLEFYFTTKVSSTPVQDRFIEGLVKTLMESCEQVLQDPFHYQARANLMWSATLALNGLSSAGLGRVGFPMHMIEHSLSAIYNIPHGAGLSIIMPGWLSYHLQKDPKRIYQFGRRVFGLHNQSDIKGSELTVQLFKNWLKSINCPTSLHDLSIFENDFAEIATNALSLAKIWRLHKYEQKTIETILHLCT